MKQTPGKCFNFLAFIEFKEVVILLICFVLVLRCESQTEKEASASMAFIHVNVLTMTDPNPKLGQTVIVKNGIISEMGPSDKVEVPRGISVVDGRNRQFLIPGLTDMHTHLDDSEGWLSDFIDNGVTTVLNLRGNSRLLALKSEVKRGEILGPTIYTSGPYVGADPGRNEDPAGISLQEIEEEVMMQKRMGYDLIKIHGNFTKKVYQRLMDVSRREGMHVMGHIPRNLTFQDALEVGQKSIAHAEELIYTQFSELDESEVIAFARKAGQVDFWMIPTITTFSKINRMWGKPGVIDSVLTSPETQSMHPFLRNLWAEDWYGSRNVVHRPRINRNYQFHFPIVRHFHEAGVKILLGTDTPLPMLAPGASVYDEIDELLKAGLSPYEVLLAATYNAGEYISTFVDANEKFGQITPGYRADMLLLNSNPLEDMRTLRKLEGVMVNGRWLRK